MVVGTIAQNQRFVFVMGAATTPDRPISENTRNFLRMFFPFSGDSGFCELPSSFGRPARQTPAIRPAKKSKKPADEQKSSGGLLGRVLPRKRRYAELGYLLPIFIGQRSKPGVSALPLGTPSTCILPRFGHSAMPRLGMHNFSQFLG